MDASVMKSIFAQRLSELRREHGMTQLELAEKLSFSNKAVSKWERGESLPDILVLKSIADLFGVTVDDLISEELRPAAPGKETPAQSLEAPAEAVPPVEPETPDGPNPDVHEDTPQVPDTPKDDVPSDGENTPAAPTAQKSSSPAEKKKPMPAARPITAMSMLGIWLVATILSVILISVGRKDAVIALPFIIALPLSFVVCVVLNSVFNRGRHNHLIISFLMWSILAAVHLSLLCFGISAPLVYVIGLPGQAIIVLCWVMVKNIVKARNP